MIEIVNIGEDPPMIQLAYPADHLKDAFDQVNGTINQLLGSRIYINSLIDPQHQPLVDNLYNDFFNFKNEIISRLLDLDTCTRYHKRDLENLQKNLKLFMFICINKKDYELGWHLDHRIIFANGILNVIDNDSHTEFSNTKEGNTHYTMPGTKNVATFWLNTENNWHRVLPMTKDRYIINFCLSFLE